MGHVGLSRASEVNQSYHRIFPIIKFENRSRTTRCRFLQSFAVPDKVVQLQTHDATTHTHRHAHTPHPYTAYRSKTREELLSFVRACFEFLTILTFRALHEDHIVSSPFQTMVEEDKHKHKKRHTLVRPHPDLPRNTSPSSSSREPMDNSKINSREDDKRSN